MRPQVLVARFGKRSELAPIVRAALAVDIVYVPLAWAPAHGRHALELWVGPDLVTTVTAELVGSGRAGQFPLRVRPSADTHVAELEALVAAVAPAAPGSGSIPAAAARPRRVSVRHDEPEMARSGPSPLATTEASVEDSTLASRRGDPGHRPSVHAPRLTPLTPLPVAPEGEPVAQTTLFDPDGILRASSPPSTGSEDSLTLPRGGLAPRESPPAAPPPPPAAPPPRTKLDSGMFVSEESGTLPRSGGGARAEPYAVSWNVRIAPTTRDPLCGRVVGNGKYVLDSVIGSGAIGIVFKASHRDLARTVAIKVLNPRYRDDADLLRTFKREGRAASQLEHPNVARVYDYGQEDDGLVYIVMEYLSGYTLGSALSARRRLAPARAVHIMMQVCAALSAAHERGIVHRDVKPDNIVLVPAQGDEGEPVEIVKVCDFGIAALGATATPEGYAAGSPEYMAPEQSTGSRVTAAADVYACGIVLYEMVTGAVPFTDSQPYRILYKHQNEPPVPPSRVVPDLHPRLEAAILRALEKKAERRFQNARELRAELRQLQ